MIRIGIQVLIQTEFYQEYVQLELILDQRREQNRSYLKTKRKKNPGHL